MKPEKISYFNINNVRVYIGSSERLAEIIAAKIEKIVTKKPNASLGLATGSTPQTLYKKLIEGYRQNNFDYSKVTTFNLDEYVGLPDNSRYSYLQYMRNNLFNHINVKRRNINIPAGNISEEEINDYTEEYSKKIAEIGIDLQILGIGRNGHIGFNEPPADLNSQTHLVDLDEKTRQDAANDTFKSLDNTPTQAITMGMKDILSARENILMAYGPRKQKIVKKMLELPINTKIPASLLRTQAQKLSVFLDKEAAKSLFPFKFHNRLESLSEWTNKEKRESIIRVALEKRKPVHKLTMKDFTKYELNIKDENELEMVKQEIINFLEDLTNQEKSREKIEGIGKIALFSPHSDDDVISAGGITLKSIKDKYASFTMTSGGNGVKEGELNVRKLESINALKTIGKSRENAFFMDLPFYENLQRIISNEDVIQTTETLNKYQPDTVFLADDLFDPSGTHKKCREILMSSIKELEQKPVVYGYRGAWDKYEIWEADLAIPLSDEEVKVNIEAIKEHKSQLNPKFGGVDKREFYERTHDKYLETAQNINLLLGENKVEFLDLYKKIKV